MAARKTFDEETFQFCLEELEIFDFEMVSFMGDKAAPEAAATVWYLYVVMREQGYDERAPSALKTLQSTRGVVWSKALREMDEFSDEASAWLAKRNTLAAVAKSPVGDFDIPF